MSSTRPGEPGSSTRLSSRCHGRGPDAPLVFCRGHGQVEQHLAQSGLAYTLLRPSSLMQNFLMSAQQVANQGVLYGMFGEGRVAFVDAPDIVAVAAELLTNPGHQGASYTLTGPEALSAAEVAERLSAATRSARSISAATVTARRWPAPGCPAGWSTAWSRATRCWPPATLRRSPTRWPG
jgi:uncharacterized protein YbjT (DUF2867 family)